LRETNGCRTGNGGGGGGGGSADIDVAEREAEEEEEEEEGEGERDEVMVVFAAVVVGVVRVDQMLTTASRPAVASTESSMNSSEKIQF
jgi:hypothetical protein